MRSRRTPPELLLCFSFFKPSQAADLLRSCGAPFIAFFGDSLREARLRLVAWRCHVFLRWPEIGSLTRNWIMKLRHLYMPDALIVALGGVLLLPGCSQPQQDSAQIPPNNQQAGGPVRYVKVTQQAIPEMLDLAAKVQADPTKVVRIFPPASGRVVAIDVKPGE